MTAPILLQSKAAGIKGKQLTFTVQFDDIISKLYYRIKNVASGKIVEQGSIIDIEHFELIREDGLYYTYEVRLPVQETFSDGSNGGNLSISIDNIVWSSSIPVSLIYEPSIIALEANWHPQENSYYITGELSFSNLGEPDALESYQATVVTVVMDGDKIDYEKEIVEQSPWLLPSGQNNINYDLNIIPELNEDYIVKIDYRTNKGYIGKGEAFISLETAGIHNTENTSNENVFFYEVDGGNVINTKEEIIITKWGIEGNLDCLRSATVYLESASAKNNYEKWVTKWYYPINRKEDSAKIRLDLEARDRYLDYDVGYKYRLRIVYQGPDEQLYQTMTNASEIYYITAADMRLEASDSTYITIRFNPSLSSYKYNTKESITPTLGAAYPIIRRNGKQKYRTFQIGGLISSEGEDSGNPLIPSSGNLNHLSDIDQECLKERFFRENVIDFLMKDEVKLYRSPTEGMMLVKLTNLNFTPNTTLGRRLWSFTAQATEVADNSGLSLQKNGFMIPPVVIAAEAFGDPVVSVKEEAIQATSAQMLENTVLLTNLKWFVQDKDGAWHLATRQ